MEILKNNRILETGVSFCGFKINQLFSNANSVIYTLLKPNIFQNLACLISISPRVSQELM